TERWCATQLQREKRCRFALGEQLLLRAAIELPLARRQHLDVRPARKELLWQAGQRRLCRLRRLCGLEVALGARQRSGADRFIPARQERAQHRAAGGGLAATAHFPGHERLPACAVLSWLWGNLARVQPKELSASTRRVGFGALIRLQRSRAMR